jgi:hypothetical protein
MRDQAPSKRQGGRKKKGDVELCFGGAIWQAEKCEGVFALR